MYVISANVNGVWVYLCPSLVGIKYRYDYSISLFDAKTFETIGEATVFYKNAIQRNLVRLLPDATRLAIRKVICKEAKLLDSIEENKEG